MLFRSDPPPPPAPPLPPSPPSASSAAPQHERRDAAHEGAPEAQAQHYEDYDPRFALKHHCTDISPSLAAPLLTPARATHCGGSGQLFCDESFFPWIRYFGGCLLHVSVREPLRSQHFPVWEGRRRRSCVAVPRWPVNVPTSLQPSLTRSTRCAGVPSGLPALALRD